MKKTRGAFTIIELLMVVAIIAVLMGIVTTATVAAMRSSREKRAEAMRVALQAAIATYHAQDANEKWPGAIESLASDGETAVLGESAAQDVFRTIVKKSIGASGQQNPLIDAGALFVARSGVKDGQGYGLGFTEAIKGGAHHQKIGVSQMVFGYQGKVTGRFHRYSIIYNGSTDSITVSKCCHNCCGTGGCTKDGRNGRQLCPDCHRGED